MTTTQTAPRLDWPRMTGRAEGRLSCICALADAAAQCVTDAASLRAALREVAAMALDGSHLSDTDPITRQDQDER